VQEWIREFVTVFHEYDNLSEDGRKFTKDLIFECSVSEVRESGSLRSIVESHAAFFKEILRIGEESLIREYFEFARTTLCYISEDELWAVNVLLFVEQVEESGYSSLQRDIDRLRVACCCAQIDMHRSNSYLRLSKYEERLSGSHDDESLVEEAIEDVKTVLYESIRKGSYQGVRLATSSISKLMEATRREQRKIQYALLSVLLDGLDYAAFTDSRVSFEAIMQSLDEVIRDLDNSDRMSEGLFKDMLGGVFSFCWTLRGYSRQQYEDRVVRFLSDLFGRELELKILLRKKELRNFYYDKWLKLGVDCLEEGDEKTLRQVSNHMGWQIAHSMKRGQNGDAQYILDRVFRLHDLSETFTISKNTRVFLLTLFAVIGSYTFTNQSFIPLRQKIVEHLVAFDQEEIEVATEIRFMPDDTWDELFSSTPQEYSSQLIGEVCSARKKSI